MTKADPRAVSADIHAGLRSAPSITNKTTIGMTATIADMTETVGYRLIVVLPHGSPSLLFDQK